MKAIRIRWRIFSMLFGFGVIAYLQQKSITIAAARMMPELGLTQPQIGWLEWGFVVGYGLLQVPAGFIGQRLGARVTLVCAGILALLATAATPLVAYVASGFTLFVVLLALQVLLGFSQAAIFPVSAGVFKAWFPRHRWALVQGLQTMGLSLGAAIAPPLIAYLMMSIGWQPAMLAVTIPSLAVVSLWAWYGRNSPNTHPSMTRSELEELGRDTAIPADPRISLPRMLGLLTERSVLLLAVGYLFMNYAFYLLSSWVFLYLVQERHFSILEGGWLAGAPPLAAAAGAGIGGWLTSALCRHLGDRWGLRLVPLVALPSAAALLLMSVATPDPYVAVIALAVCFGTLELCEGAFWSGAMTIGRRDTMAVSAMMNTGGVIGGVVGIPVVAYLSANHMWSIAFALGAALSILSAIAWLGIDAGSPTVDSSVSADALTRHEGVLG